MALTWIDKTKALIAARAHGGDSPSAKSARVAIKSFDDLDHLDDLKRLLPQLTDAGERDGLHAMLEALVRNTGRPEVAQFMMDQVARETSKTPKASLLERIGGLKVKAARDAGNEEVWIKDASNALACLSEKMRSLRTAAIGALGQCSDPRAEAALIELIDQQLRTPAESGWYLYGAVCSLSKVATAKALPCALNVIEKIGALPLKTRKADIEALSVKTIAGIAGPKQLDLFCALLEKNKPPVVKWHAMRALGRYARKTHVPAIRARVQAVLSAKRVLPQTDPPFLAPDVGDVLFSLSEGEDAKRTELLWAFAALERLSAFKDRDLVQLLREKWPALTAAERAFLRGASGDFADLRIE